MANNIICCSGFHLFFLCDHHFPATFLFRHPWAHGTSSTLPSWHALPITTWPPWPTCGPASRWPASSSTSWWCLWPACTRCPPELCSRSQRPQTRPAHEAGGPSGLSQARNGQALNMPPAMAETQTPPLTKAVTITTQIQYKQRSWLFS